MSNNSESTNSGLIRFVMSTYEYESSDKEKAREFLSVEGLNVDEMVTDGMKRLKQLQLQIEAEKTKEKMESAKIAKQKASEWVDKLINTLDFSLIELVKQEKLTMSFKNIEKLGKKDIREILVKHFTLKFLEEQTKRDNEF
jgi:hypothetical protein